MAIVCAVLGVILGIAAWHSDTRGMRLWFWFWSAANLAVCLLMISDGFTYAWRLAPWQPDETPPYRR